MPGDHVVTGTLHGIGIRIPAWVTPSGRRVNYVEHVYIRLPSGYGLSAKLNETLHRANDLTVHGFRCYIPITSNVIFTAILKPYNPNLHFSSTLQVFLRLPRQNGMIYTGIPQLGHHFSDNLVH